MSVLQRRYASVSVFLAVFLSAPCAHAIRFDIEWGDGVSGTLNTVMTLGAGMRMEDRSVNLVGKGNLNPNVCGGMEQSCQGVFRDQTHPAETLAASPGQAFLNADDGNWNYDKGDLTQAVFKVTQDLKLTYLDYGFFAKWLYFYDFVNNDFTEFHPNWITRENRDRVGSTGSEDSSGFGRAYGPGEPTYRKRTDGEVLRQIGTDLQIFDYYFYGVNTLPFTEDHQVSWKIGSQTLNWGESTALVINSVNQVNGVNANNLTRVGFDLSELFVPTRMLVLSTELVENTTMEAFYGFEWKPLEIPAPGSFFSFADLGTNNAVDYASISFGGPAEEPEICGTGAPPSGSDAQYDYYNPYSGCGSPTNNPLSGLTPTSLRIQRMPDREASNLNQFGVAVKYFAEWLNNGTELGFYFMNYHSKLPYVSFYSSDASCARELGNAQQMDATNGPTLLAFCNDADTPYPSDLPVVAGQFTGDPSGATRNAVPIDTVRYQVEYPEDIKMFGMSFTTTLGDFSVQGELSYRPNLPVQVDLQDLTFLALQPMLARCHDPINSVSGPCEGTTAGVSQVDQTNYGSSDFIPYPDWAQRFPQYAALTSDPQYASTEGGYKDTFDLGVGAGVGSARSFPSFVGAYRGIAAGEMPPNTYIQGWERFKVWQLDLGATYVQGATDNVIGADQVIWLFEAGAQYVPDLPGTEILQAEAPGTHYHASAGADGSMTGNYSQDCASTPDCNFGPDGLRFNPHQQPAEDYADPFSWGIAVVNLTRYESVFPGISFAPLTLFMYDVKGTSVDVASQFSEHRAEMVTAFEIRYRESLSFVPGYLFFWGGSYRNLSADRDQAFTYVKYLF
jgi:hypothetical protein